MMLLERHSALFRVKTTIRNVDNSCMFRDRMWSAFCVRKYIVHKFQSSPLSTGPFSSSGWVQSKSAFFLLLTTNKNRSTIFYFLQYIFIAYFIHPRYSFNSPENSYCHLLNPISMSFCRCPFSKPHGKSLNQSVPLLLKSLVYPIKRLFRHGCSFHILLDH